MPSQGLINGHSATVSATGAAGVEMIQTAGFSFETVGVGVLVWLICKILDAAYLKLNK